VGNYQSSIFQDLTDEFRALTEISSCDDLSSLQIVEAILEFEKPLVAELNDQYLSGDLFED
jgi:hypothetical protein